MKLTLKSSLGEFQNLMSEGLGDHQEVLALFRENTSFSHFLDVECIPPPLFLWQLIAREAKIKRKGEMWFVVKGVSELTSTKNDFIRAHFPSAKKGKKSASVTYKMVVQRFLDICKGLDREKKKEGQEMDAVKMATLLFVVVVLLGPADRDKSAILDWILGMIAQWTAVLDFPWGTWAFMESLGSLRKDLAAKAKSIGRGASSTMYYTGFLLPIGILFLEREEATKTPVEVPETTIMDDCEQTEARNPSPDDKAESTHEVMETDDAASMKPLQNKKELGDEADIIDAHVHGKVEPSHEVMETDAAASMKTLQDKELGDEADTIDAHVHGKRLKKKLASLKSPYIAEGRKKKKADELLSKPPTKRDLLEFKRFIAEAIKTDSPVQCYLEQHKEHEEYVKTWWTNLITPGLWVADTQLSEYLYVLRRRLCNDDGDSVIAPFEFTTYVNSFAHDPQWPVLSGPIEKIVDGTYSEEQEAFKTKAWKKNTKYVYYLKATGTHWFCVKADFERCCLVVLDSLSGISTNEDMHRLLKDELKGFSSIAGIKEIGKHGYATWDIELCPVPQQNNSDCGIFAVKMLELGAQHKDFKSLEKMTKEKMANMRLEIAYYICKEYHCRNKK
ncbi:unnamed protein product [Cuscuta campestris]|uniref:Ubiquitin-like protease family profile domain-containing protein n=1 Tax=Cuscuta campestris TaxID=132261 RepID=A0A484KXZ6_9ASTE|nr:unnamed protein product [Cuscuta campestris]